jgi:uncharacterized protein
MPMTKTPVYVVCANSVKLQSSFYLRFCKEKHPLRVRFEQDPPDDPTEGDVCRIGSDMKPVAAGREIANRLAKESYDAVWMDWNDDLPVERLLDVTRQTDFRRLCSLKRIIRCADGEAVLSETADPGLQRQLAQCDLLAVPQNGRRELRKLRSRVIPLQPNIKVISMENAAAVAVALKRRDARRGLQVILLMGIVAALFMGLKRLNYTASDTMATFLGTYLQALPFLMLGILLSSAIQVFVPADLLQRIFPKRHLPGMLFGVLGGFMLPICDCASIPVFRSLLRKGVPLPAAVTFMIAAPIINPVVLLSTYYAFGGSVPIMLMRMGFGVVCSVIIGLCFVLDKKSVLLSGAASPVCACGIPHNHGHHDGETCACGHHHAEDHAAKGWKAKCTALLVHFQAELFEVVRFLLIGIGVSTVLQLSMGSRIMNLNFSGLFVSMLVMMALAFFLSLCSSSDAVVGKNMGATLPLGAVMSFMVFGPMIDVKNMILMSASFTRRFMVKLLIVTFLVSFLTVYITFSLGLQRLIV